MPMDKRLWSIYDGELMSTVPAARSSFDSKSTDDTASTVTASRTVSSSSTASSASSVDPLVKQKPFKVPLHVATSLAHRGFDVDHTGVVTWRSNSLCHPRNWASRRKTYDAAIIIFLEFFMTLVSNTGSSVAAQAASDLGITREIALVCFTTAYLMAQALGGLILPPIAETFGGRTIYIAGTAGFTGCCVLMAAVPTLPVVIFGRTMCGFMSALPATVAVSSFENMFDSRARIWVIHIWIAGAICGLGIGPAVATYISTSHLGWSWVACLSAIISGISTILCFGMKESRPSQVLRQEIKAISRSSGFDELTYDSTDSVPNFKTFCETSLVLPIRLFFTEPIVFLTSIMAATVCAVIYVFPEAFPIVFAEGFGFTDRQCSLVNLALAVGVLFTFLPRLYDIRVFNLCRRNNVLAEPEDKIFGFLVAAPILAAAFWWFSLTIPPLNPALSPMVPIASLALVGFSVVEFDTVLSGYLTDTYTSYAASANASLSFLRAILSGIFPLFGGRIFRSLGANNAMFVLAGVATLYCAVAILFARFGKRIRLKSRFAQESRVLESEKAVV